MKTIKKRKKRKKKEPKRLPSTNGGNGRDQKTGQFLPGNPGGPGNPHSVQVAQLRSALLGAVTPEDIQAVVKQLVKLARKGTIAAIRELLDRTVGRISLQYEVPEETIEYPPEEEIDRMYIAELRQRGFKVIPPKGEG